MEGYRRLSKEERAQIEFHISRGHGCRYIARILGRSASTISREIRRHQHWLQGYVAELAHNRWSARRKRASSKISGSAAARAYIAEKLADKKSPEQISALMRLEKQPFYACHETLYRFIYSRKGWEMGLPRLLPRKQPSRYYRGTKRPKPVTIPAGQSIHSRSKFIDNRLHYGHLEGDLVFGQRTGKDNITTIVERKSRFAIAIKNDNKQTKTVICAIKEKLKSLPENLRRSITFDQGTEFAAHQMLHDIGLKTYFCDPHSPWQKGGNENFNGRLRRYLPKNTNLAQVSQQQLDRIIEHMNNTPRKCLGYKTPKQALQAYLHRVLR